MGDKNFVPQSSYTNGNYPAELAAYKKQYYDALLRIQRAKGMHQFFFYI